MPDIFLSYSRADRRFMEPLRDYLVSRGLDVWTDENLEPGTSVWFREVDQAIRESRIMLVLMSPHLLEPNPDNPEYGSFVLNEVQQALQLRKKFYTILLDGDEVSAVPLQLKAIQWVDVRGRYVRSVDEVYSRLAQQMANDLGVELKDPPTHQVQVTVEGDVSGTLSVAGGNIFGGLGAPPALAWPEEIGQAFDGLPDPPREGLRDASPISRRYALMLVQRDLLPDAKLREPLSQVLSYMAQHDTDSETKGLAQTVLQALPAPAARVAEPRRRPVGWVGAAVVGVVVLAGIAALGSSLGGRGGATAEATTATPTQEPTLTADERARALAEAGVTRNADWTPYTEEINGVLMALVPAGCFMMGSTDEQIDYAMTLYPYAERSQFEDEQPAHEVCFEEPFWIDVYEVTNEQFAAFGGEARRTSYRTESDRPREQITWTEAAAFCERRGMRLPTEAEWEYAARGPDSLIYPWGNEFVADNAVYAGNSEDHTWAVGSRPGGMSWVGAYDLSGNVWEWVNDRYDEGYYATLADGVVNPQGPASGSSRVVRGGSWFYAKDDVRAAIRVWLYPSSGDLSNGFRCALSVLPAGAPTATVASALETARDPFTLAQAGVTRNADWTPYTEKINGVLMALVPAGCFMMGSTDGDSDEEPVHEVCFEEPFWIDVYEVTNEQFAAFGGEAGDTSYRTESDRPREQITWTEAAAFCGRRGMRLPTEAEWEYAARGPDSLIYPWGNEFVADNAVYAGNSEDHTWAVGSRPGGMSWVGAYDLSGNVWEWVNDRYDEGYYATLADGVVNPQGPASGSSRVVRGGSWGNDASVVRAAVRYFSYYPDVRLNPFGFRCGGAVPVLP